MTIFHITDIAGLCNIRQTGTLSPPSLADEGFVHCSTAEQLDGVVGRWFADASELVFLEIEETRLTAELRWDEVYPGQRFPHLYGPLNFDAVTGAKVQL